YVGVGDDEDVASGARQGVGDGLGLAPHVAVAPSFDDVHVGVVPRPEGSEVLPGALAVGAGAAARHDDCDLSHGRTSFGSLAPCRGWRGATRRIGRRCGICWRRTWR